MNMRKNFRPYWLSVVFLGTGLGLLVLFGITRSGEQAKRVASLSGSQGLAHFQWAQKLPLKPAFSGLPSFGLVCALVLSWLVMIHMLFQQMGRFRSKGLGVLVMKQVPLPESSDRWTQPLVLSVQASGPGSPPKLYLNSKPLSWEALDSTLKTELGKRSVWIV